MLNANWLSIITMTTVGYGDFYPQSFAAQLIGIFCMFYGVYTISLFVVASDNLFVMEPSQQRATILIDRLQKKDLIEKRATNLLVSTYRVRKSLKGGL